MSANGQESPTSMGFTTAFARDAAAYGVPPAIIGKLVQTTPGRMAWLTPDDLKPMEVVILSPSSPQARPLPKTLPQTPSTTQPGEMLALVMPVSGAPGDGQEPLTFALKERLSVSGIKLANAPGQNVYAIKGNVILDQAGWRKQSIRIEWQVFNPNGKRIGTVHQQNTIPSGSLDGAWGAVADAAVVKATDDILRLFKRENP